MWIWIILKTVEESTELSGERSPILKDVQVNVIKNLWLLTANISWLSSLMVSSALSHLLWMLST